MLLVLVRIRKMGSIYLFFEETVTNTNFQFDTWTCVCEGPVYFISI